MPTFKRVLYVLLVPVVFGSLLAGCRGKDELEHGGRAYLAQCAVCHGVHGNGDGPLAEEIVVAGSTPPVSLRSEAVQALDKKAMRLSIQSSAHFRSGSSMPAWGPHLGDEWTNRIADYCLAMPTLGDEGSEAVEAYLADPDDAPSNGRSVFVLYCSGCHGPEGRGDGFFSPTLARLVEPADLTEAVARLDDEELRALIGAGGSHAPEAPSMPGWLHTISTSDQDALWGYLQRLP